MMRLRRGALAVVVGMAAGCASTDPGPAFDDVRKVVGERTGMRVEWDRGTADDAAVAAGVGQMMAHPLSAEEAVQVALLNNRHLRAEYEELGIAQAELVQAGLLKNPTFFASARFPDRSPHVVNTEFAVAADFVDLLAVPLRKKVAAAALDTAKLRVADEVLKLAAEVKAAYYRLAAREQVLAMQRTITEAAAASAELARRQMDAGNINELDAANERAASLQAKLDVARTQAEVVADREELVRLMGLWGKDASGLAVQRLAEVPAGEAPLDGLESRAISQRLDLAAAKAEAASIARALGLTRSYGLWSVEVGVDTEREPDRTNVTGPEVTVELPVFDQKQGKVADLAARYRQAKERVEATAIDIRSQVRAARDRMIAARDAAAYYRDELIPQRERIVALSQRRYNGMLLGVYQLIAAKQAEVSAYREYVEATRDYWAARAELERAVGGRLAKDANDE